MARRSPRAESLRRTPKERVASVRVPDEASLEAEPVELRRDHEALLATADSLRDELELTRERAAASEAELDRRLEAVRTVQRRNAKGDALPIPPRALGVAIGRTLKRLRLRIALLRHNPLFDADWYLRMNHDVRLNGMDPYRHYRKHGAREGRDPSPFIDRNWYLARNPDVASKGMDPMDHYLLFGASEGRNPCLSFHSDCYLAMYPDVLLDRVNPLLHYQKRGISEGRRLCESSHEPSLRLTPRQRHGELLDEVLEAGNGRPDVLWFGVIDWEFRTQRPQHLASRLADAGHRVIYVSPHFDSDIGNGRFGLTSNPHGGVFQVRLRLSRPLPSLYEGLADSQGREAMAAIRECADVLSIRNPIAVIQFPAWRKVAMSLPSAVVVLDCLDHVAGFSNVSASVVEEEQELIAQADVAVASSQQLAETLGQTRPTTLIRNGADTRFFAEPPSTAPLDKTKPTIGYFGAISEWFEIGWITHAARVHGDWDFVLIGSMDGCDVTRVERMPNVHLLGEQPYADLPGYLHQFDVAIIPFQLNELINNTNPVKLYEYLSAGVPVVASPMPEMEGLGDLVYLAGDKNAFVQQIERALEQDSEEHRKVRQTWATHQDWSSRAQAFEQAVAQAFVKVSVIVLCHNNWRFTDVCLHSILTLSDYPGDLLEVIVVDNASQDETADRLLEYERQDARVRVISSAENLGFAGGNNIGIRQATGDIVILLNNDTCVTRGWVRRLMRPLIRDSRIGLSGPVTNNIGNEQKLNINYGSMEEMQREATRFTDDRLGETYETDSLAFFCVAIRREVLGQVGLLDEEFGLGFFEDDDYCRRAAAMGWRMVIADDAFVHHHLSASFDKIGEEARRQLWERNQKIYEAKWGPWRPHKYRDARGFGA